MIQRFKLKLRRRKQRKMLWSLMLELINLGGVKEYYSTKHVNVALDALDVSAEDDRWVALAVLCTRSEFKKLLAESQGSSENLDYIELRKPFWWDPTKDDEQNGARRPDDSITYLYHNVREYKRHCELTGYDATSFH